MLTASELNPNRRVEIAIEVNGTSIRQLVPTRLLLSDFLRNELGLCGVRVGCGEGVCGSCTILMNGYPARACTLLAVQAAGECVATIEGMNAAVGLTPLQIAFKQLHALQCGFCTPGILNSLTFLFAHSPNCDEEEIRTILTGHLCRCTGYKNIVGAAVSHFRATRDQQIP